MNRELLSALRSDLTAAGYSSDSVAALWGPAAEGSRARGVFLPAERGLAARRSADPASADPASAALGTLARVFLLGGTATAAELDGALPELGHAGASDLGLVVGATNGGFRAALALNPVAVPAPGSDDGVLEWWIISDLDDALRRGPARPDHVMGVGGATRTLLAQLDPRPVASALDLGTGCGIVAMYLAAMGADRVVATDISERALGFARANAQLNGLEGRIELRHGDLFAPVAGEPFELIVSNPPFVITPRDADGERYEYRDGGMTGDELAATVVREAPAHLAPGGELVCLANWETPWGGDGLARVGEWIAAGAAACGSGLDAWVIERDRVDPARYAETWARDGGARPGDAQFDGMLGSWLADFDARRVVAVGLGSIRVRRTAHTESEIRTEQAMGTLAAAGAGSAFAACFAAGAATARMSDEEVLGTRWIRSPRVVEEREYEPGAESPSAIALVVDAPVGRRLVADPMLAGALGACDGELTLGQLSDALATLLDVDEAVAADALVEGVRELAWSGMIAPE